MNSKPDADRVASAEDQKRLRSRWLALSLAAIGAVLIRNSFLFWAVLGFAGLLAAGGLALGFGIAASWVGFRIFGMFDRVIHLVRRAVRWPDETLYGAKAKSEGRDDWDEFRPS